MKRIALIALSSLSFLAVRADELTEAINHNNLDKVMALIKLRSNTLANEPQEYKKHALTLAQDNITKQAAVLDGFKSSSRTKNLAIGLTGLFLGSGCIGNAFSPSVILEIFGSLIGTYNNHPKFNNLSDGERSAAALLVTNWTTSGLSVAGAALTLLGIQRTLKAITNSEQKDNFAHASAIKQSLHDAFKA